MYEQKFPEVDDLVMVTVNSIVEHGAYVSLLEYKDIEGMILLSEISRRRIRSISQLIRVGKDEVVVVLRVDKEKGYIDLSKRRVSVEDVAKCEEKFNKSKTVHSIMRHVAGLTNRITEDLYLSFCWSLYKKYGHAYDAFKLAISTPAGMDSWGVEIDPDVKEILVRDISRRLTPQAAKVRADFEVSCFRYEGIDAIKAALLKGQALSTPDLPIKIKLVAPPLFVIITTSIDKESCIKVLNQALEKISEEIKKSKGNLVIKIPPRAVSEHDDKEFNEQLIQAEKEQLQVDGDDDVSGDEGGTSSE